MSAGALASSYATASDFFPSPNKKLVVLCVVAGVARQHFHDTFRDISVKNTHLGNIRYNGFSAGHYVALTSMLSGKYLSEKETALFRFSDSPLFPKGKTSHIITECHLPFMDMNDAENVHDIQYDGINTGIMWEDEADTLVSERGLEILKNENPEIMLVHFFGADRAHDDLPTAERNRRHICNGIEKLWHAAKENHPDVLFMAVSDFGRNNTPNTLGGTDHSIYDNATRDAAFWVTGTGKIPSVNGIKESTDVLAYVMKWKK